MLLQSDRFGSPTELTAVKVASAVGSHWELIPDADQPLAARRQDLGLTQAEVAERAGLTQADISRLERALGNPTEVTLDRVAAALEARWKYELVPRVPA